ncbi:MAG: family 20 glycosylhydrolase, partial [Balneolaceae bacterium]|nr:family 20 glycosylhydrolase [Balneolaceae bacterium]
MVNYYSSNSILGFVLLYVWVLAGCTQNDSSQDQNTLGMEITESPIEISWKVISNFEEDDKFSAQLTFHNTGNETFPADGWTLYLNSIRAMDAESFMPEFEATHINGDFFSLEPTNAFEPIPAGESRLIEYLGSYHAIKKTDAPQGFYFVFEDDHIETVESVDVQPFVTEEQVNRNQDDNLAVPTAESRYRENEDLIQLSHGQMGKITPMPGSVEYANAVYELMDGVTITYNAEFSGEADYLSQILEDEFNIEPSTEPLGGDWDGSGILLNMDGTNFNQAEAYTLQISEHAVEISAGSNAGIFYGIQSLRSLLSNRNSDNLELSEVEIEDYPGFGYRGMHLDVARNFQSKESVVRLLEIMGMYKLNKFHFHLTDDEGWRLAIEGLPELTEVGGRRGHTETEEEFLFPSYGSGPDPTPGSSFGSGWYSRDEYIEILKFADERHIEVIPEIDVPGHALAAIKGMEVRYNRLLEFGQEGEAGMYRLTDPEDESEYMSVQSFDDNV